ncbi:MAG TPA: hypothetical protein VFZ34_16635 [Blastocatellia bacterium]|nr:hypothetical protein [Blastocatellia bacterium]
MCKTNEEEISTEASLAKNVQTMERIVQSFRETHALLGIEDDGITRLEESLQRLKKAADCSARRGNCSPN